MPKIPTDYLKTIIYQICCKDLLVTNKYVGHTTNFTQRKKCHKLRCNNLNDKKHNFKLYQIIRDYGNWDNWEMIEIEKYPCNDGNEATARERYWYETLNANMNSNVPNRSQKEHYEINKNNILKYQKEKITCECGSIFRIDGKSRHLKNKKHINFINSL